MTERLFRRAALLLIVAGVVPALVFAQAPARGTTVRASGGAPVRDAVPKPERAQRPIIILINHVPGAWDYPYNSGNLQMVGGYVQQQPPAPQFEARPHAPPGPAMAWISGHYQWDGAAYSWVLGQWTPIPGGFTRWEDGRWAHNALGWYWMRGRWVE